MFVVSYSRYRSAFVGQGSLKLTYVPEYHSYVAVLHSNAHLFIILHLFLVSSTCLLMAILTTVVTIDHIYKYFFVFTFAASVVTN